jgi:regulator of sigma E protease
MELLTNGSNVLLILLGFGLLIFVHELGHFVAARWAGIRCESFAIGMGPPLVAWRRGIGLKAGSTDPATIARHGKTALEMDDAELARNGIGETEWSLRAFPLGGYVRMLGQDDLDPAKVSSERRSYQRAPVWKRMIVVTAGVASNLVLAVALFVLAFMVGVRFEAPVVGAVVPGSPAEQAGLRAGDRVVAIDGSRVDTFADIQIAGAMAKPGQEISIDVERPATDGTAQPRTETIRVTPRKDPASGLLQVGIEPALSPQVGEARPAERRLFETTMTRLGLGPEGTGPASSPLRTLVAVDGSPAPTTTSLADAAARSGGAPVRTRWRTDAGTEVERDLRPLPELEQLRTLPRAGMPAEADRGLVGLVPLLRVEGIPDGSENVGVLLAGDVVLRAGTAHGPRLGQLRAQLAAHSGRTVEMVVLREGAERTVQAKVNARGLIGVQLGLALDVPMTASPHAAAVGAGGTERPTPVAPLEILPRTRIESIGGRAVTDWASMRTALAAATAEAAARGEAETVELVLTSPTPGHERIEGSVAIAPDEVQAIRELGWASPVPAAIFEPLMTTLTAHGNPLTAVSMGFHQTRTLVTMTYLTLDRIFRGTVGVEQLRGPVGIVHLGSRVVDRGAMYLAFFLAMISVNLAVLNFLPLPIVDGGLFLYLLYERFTGNPPSVRFQNAATTVGLVLLGGLFLFTFYNDVMRLFTGG